VPVEIDEIGSRLGGEVIRFDRVGQGDRRPDLIQVRRAVGAGPYVALETASLPTREPALEVIGDKLNGLLALDVSPSQQQHPLDLLHFGLKDRTHPGAPPVQKDPLIAPAYPEHGAHISVRELLDVPEEDDLTLALGQSVERGLEDR
jgi:hypothetical protein